MSIDIYAACSIEEKQLVEQTEQRKEFDAYIMGLKTPTKFEVKNDEFIVYGRSNRVVFNAPMKRITRMKLVGNIARCEIHLHVWLTHWRRKSQPTQPNVIYVTSWYDADPIGFSVLQRDLLKVVRGAIAT